MHPSLEGATQTAMFKLAYTTESAQNKEDVNVLTVIVYVRQNNGSPVFSTVSAAMVYKLVTAMPHVCCSLNRMHIMEDEGSKPSATLESLPKASRSPTPCQNAVQAVDSEKRGVCGEENAAAATNMDEGQQKSPSSELLETSKTVTDEEEEEETHTEKEGTVKFSCLVATVAII